MLLSSRKIYLLSFVAVASLLLFSLYLQFFAGVIPCLLCTLQRVCFASIGIASLIGVLLARRRISRQIVNLIGIVLSVTGIVFAIRQIWLQLHPDASSNECSVSLQYMMQVLPVNEVMKKIFAGSAECASRDWSFLGLSMPEWAVIWFIGYGCLFFYLLLQNKKIR